jgi:hypothetical protein
MQSRNIMAQNLIPEIKIMLTRGKFGKQLAFHSDQTAKIPVCSGLLPQTQEPSPSLRRNLISIW